MPTSRPAPSSCCTARGRTGRAGRAGLAILVVPPASGGGREALIARAGLAARVDRGAGPGGSRGARRRADARGGGAARSGRGGGGRAPPRRASAGADRGGLRPALGPGAAGTGRARRAAPARLTSGRGSGAPASCLWRRGARAALGRSRGFRRCKEEKEDLRRGADEAAASSGAFPIVGLRVGPASRAGGLAPAASPPLTPARLAKRRGAGVGVSAARLPRILVRCSGVGRVCCRRGSEGGTGHDEA